LSAGEPTFNQSSKKQEVDEALPILEAYYDTQKAQLVCSESSDDSEEGILSFNRKPTLEEAPITQVSDLPSAVQSGQETERSATLPLTQ
jgi:hypothetical protein